MLVKCSSLTDSAGVNTSVKSEVLAAWWHGASMCEVTQCQGGKASAVIVGILFLPLHLRGVDKPFGVHHFIMRKIFHKCKTFRTVSSFPRQLSPKSDGAVLKKNCKKPKSYISVCMLNAKFFTVCLLEPFLSLYSFILKKFTWMMILFDFYFL